MVTVRFWNTRRSPLVMEQESLQMQAHLPPPLRPQPMRVAYMHSRCNCRYGERSFPSSKATAFI